MSFEGLLSIYAAEHPATIPTCGMLIDEVEAIWSAIAERDDWSPLQAKIVAIREYGAALRSGLV